MDDLISRKALREAVYHEAFEMDSGMQKWDSGCWIRYKMFENHLKDTPSVPAVPIKAISTWLAAYAAPPKYALDEIAGTDPGRIVTVDTLVRAWEYHWKNLMECGLIGEGSDADRP